MIHRGLRIEVAGLREVHRTLQRFQLAYSRVPRLLLFPARHSRLPQPMADQAGAGHKKNLGTGVRLIRK
jgi:hypothetical protein